jgi:hypothetical protein
VAPQASFSFYIDTTPKGKKRSFLTYRDNSAGLNFTSRSISGVVIGGNHIHFKAAVKIGKTNRTFTVDADDEPDTFFIQGSNGYSAGGPLASGNVFVDSDD